MIENLNLLQRMLFLEGGIYGNIAAAILTLVYVKVVISLCDYGVQHRFIPADVSRKLVHLAAASLMIWWPLFDDSHPTWRLNILVPAIFSIQLFVKGAILQNPNDPDVRTMSRTGQPIELLYGPLVFTICMNINGIYLFNKPEAVYCMAALGYGDGLAPLVGVRAPIQRYRCPGGIKSVGGSMAVFWGSIGGFFLLRTILGIPRSIEWAKIFVMAITATLAEGLAPGDFDNVAVPLSVFIVLKLIA